MAQSSEVTKTIVKTVADCENVSPEELPPLADKLNPESYDYSTAIESDLTDARNFEYLWYDVTVLPDGEVNVTS